MQPIFPGHSVFFDGKVNAKGLKPIHRKLGHRCGKWFIDPRTFEGLRRSGTATKVGAGCRNAAYPVRAEGAQEWGSLPQSVAAFRRSPTSAGPCWEGGRGSSRRRRITQLASNGNPRLSLPTSEVDALSGRCGFGKRSFVPDDRVPSLFGSGSEPGSRPLTPILPINRAVLR